MVSAANIGASKSVLGFSEAAGAPALYGFWAGDHSPGQGTPGPPTSILDRHAPAEDPLVQGAEVRQRTDLEGGVLVGGLGEQRQVDRHLGRAAAEEGGGAEG
jgi:hypothetical protein